MRPLKFLLLGFIILTVITATAQNGSVLHEFYVHGWVKDSTMMNAVPNHWVYLKSNPPGTASIFDSCLTNSFGHFLFDSLHYYYNHQLDLDVFTFDCHHAKIKYHYWIYQPSITTFFSICADEQTFCHADFDWQLVGLPENTVHFTDLSSQNASLWIWDFGDGNTSDQQNPNHTYSQTGIYQVHLQIVDTTHIPYCFDTRTQEVIVTQVGQHHLSGQIFDGNFPETGGSVYLYGEVNEGYLLLDSSTLNTSGVYYFYSIPEGRYMVKYVPEPGTPSLFLPSYPDQCLQWQQCTPVDLQQDIFDCDFHLTHTLPPDQGPGFISGIMQKFWNGNPLLAKREEILLCDETFQFRYFCFTDQLGVFQFTDLSFGSYWLIPEIPGMNSNPVLIVIDSTHLTVSNLQLFAQNAPLAVNEPKEGDIQSLIFPNPTSGQLTLLVPGLSFTRAEIHIYDLPGKEVSSAKINNSAGNHVLSLDLSLLPDGSYFLLLQTNDRQWVRKKFLVIH